jgi:hypothetical protein
LIVDEGHDIGRSNNKNDIGRSQKRTPKIQKQKRYEAKNHLRQLLKASDFILEIAAERRWVMSDGLQGKEEKWKEWENEIINPCLKQDPSDWGNLSKMLKSLMIRHSKESTILFDPFKSMFSLDAIEEKDDCLYRSINS